MIPMDGFEVLAAARRAELRGAAVRYRQARRCRPAARRGAFAMRLYTRIWWASRPRFSTWGGPEGFDPVGGRSDPVPG